MRKFKIKKLNNQGSTFVMALLVITLLTTLALALANASIGNMMMKSIDRGSKKTFYTSETLLDEIRAGIGYSSMDNLALAYEVVLTNLVDYNATDAATVVDNTEANTQFRKRYIDNVLSTITGGKLQFGTEASGNADNISSEFAHNAEEINTNAKAYIQAFIAYEDMAEVKSVGLVKAYKNASSGYIVIIEDVTVAYKEEKSGETYFSNITADLEIEFPNMVVDFTTTNTLNDFINYTVIADNSLTIAGQTVNVNASAYAGNIIDIAPAGSVAGDVTFQQRPGTSTNINVICGGNVDALSGTIRVGGNTQVASTARFYGANIWCTNIATRRMFGDGTDEATMGANIVIGDNCNTYVKDDLSVDAQNSNVTVGGEYYGYMYDGRDNTSGHLASSAIIVNGKKSSVTISTRKLFLGGRAYIDIADSSLGAYMTGESMGLKGDQEVYLVPSKFLGGNPNPMSIEQWEAFGGSLEEPTPEPPSEEPSSEEPSSEEPSSSVPPSTEPSTTQPPTTQPSTTQPSTNRPWPWPWPWPGYGEEETTTSGRQPWDDPNYWKRPENWRNIPEEEWADPDNWKNLPNSFWRNGRYWHYLPDKFWSSDEDYWEEYLERKFWEKRKYQNYIPQIFWDSNPDKRRPGGRSGMNNSAMRVNAYAYSSIRPDLTNRISLADVVIAPINIPDDYFAKQYLNASVPYVTRKVGDLVYVYWNFTSSSAATKYIKDVLNGKDIELKDKLNQYTRNLFSDGNSFVRVDTNVVDPSNVYATGILMEATGGLSSGSSTSYTEPTGVMPEVLFTQNSLDYRNRYEIYTHLLASIPWDHESARYYVMDSSTALEQLRDFQTDGNELTQTSIINNIIDMVLLEGNEYNGNGQYFVYQPSGDGSRNLVKMITKASSYTVPSDVHGGIIICKGNITLDHDFDGLLLAGGDINIVGNATLTTDPEKIEQLILGYESFVDRDGNRVADTEDVPFKQYFHAYKVGAVIEDSRENVKIEDINYRDLVSFNNWRKYED